MQQTDDKINSMIKYLNIYKNFKTDKINKMSHSMTQRFNFDDKRNRTNVINQETSETNKIKLYS